MNILVNENLMITCNKDEMGIVLEVLQNANKPTPKIEFITDPMPTGSEEEIVAELQKKISDLNSSYYKLYSENMDLKKKLADEPAPVVGVDLL